MHPSIKFTFENPEIIYEKEKKVQVLNFLDEKTILHENKAVAYLLQTNEYSRLLTIR